MTAMSRDAAVTDEETEFGRIQARACEVLGSEAAAVRWLNEPALALGRRKPFELLSTTGGLEMVANYLTRLEYSVYT